MNGRIENYEAGETLLHQIKFLLAVVADQGTPAIATSRYELDFPVLPPKACAIWACWARPYGLRFLRASTPILKDVSASVVVFAAVSQNRQALYYAPAELEADCELVLTPIAQYRQVIVYAPAVQEVRNGGQGYSWLHRRRCVA